jgi:hypothetical protein
MGYMINLYRIFVGKFGRGNHFRELRAETGSDT